MQRRFHLLNSTDSNLNRQSFQWTINPDDERQEPRHAVRLSAMLQSAPTCLRRMTSKRPMSSSNFSNVSIQQ